VDKAVTAEVVLMAHTQLASDFRASIEGILRKYQITDGQAISLSAIRTCYSPNKPTEVVSVEGDKYFGTKATDGELVRMLTVCLGILQVVDTLPHLNILALRLQLTALVGRCLHN
jgi:hypothetical protein